MNFADTLREELNNKNRNIIATEFEPRKEAIMENIAKGIKRFAQRGKVRLGGLIGNSRNTPKEKELLEAFAKKLNTRLIAFIPRDQIVQKAEIRRQTVIQYAPDSCQAQVYRELAKNILDNKELSIPTTMTFEELEAFMAEMGAEDNK